MLHDTLPPAWKALEWLPKSATWMEWKRQQMFGYYIPDGESRLIADPLAKPRIHQPVIDRKAQMPDYTPINFPAEYDIEP